MLIILFTLSSGRLPSFRSLNSFQNYSRDYSTVFKAQWNALFGRYIKFAFNGASEYPTMNRSKTHVRISPGNTWIPWIRINYMWNNCHKWRDKNQSFKIHYTLLFTDSKEGWNLMWIWKLSTFYEYLSKNKLRAILCSFSFWTHKLWSFLITTN